MATSLSNPETKEDLLIATFQLGGDDGFFGIDATLIQEVVMVGELRPVRHAPDYVAGIRNLRGKIITVIDLCVRLELGAVEIGTESRILIADWKGEPVGLLVDRVADAIAVRADDLESPPRICMAFRCRSCLEYFAAASVWRRCSIFPPYLVQMTAPENRSRMKK